MVAHVTTPRRVRRSRPPAARQQRARLCVCVTRDPNSMMKALTVSRTPSVVHKAEAWSAWWS